MEALQLYLYVIVHAINFFIQMQMQSKYSHPSRHP